MKFEAPPGANINLIGNGSTVADIHAVKTEFGFIVALRPDREELKRLIAGAPIYISVLGHTFSPMAVEVADPTEAPTAESLTRDPY